MSLLLRTVNGKVLDVFPETVKNAEGESGKKWRVTLIGDVLRLGGDGTKPDMLQLTVPGPEEYQDFMGQRISVPVDHFSPGKGQIITFVPKGAKPQVID